MVDQELLVDVTESYLKSVISGASGSLSSDFNSFAAFGELGINSFQVLKIIKTLEGDFGALPKSLLFEKFTIHDLANYFVAEHATTLHARFALTPDGNESAVRASEPEAEIRAVPVPPEPSGPLLFLEKDAYAHPELGELVRALYERYKVEGSVSRGTRKIAPNLFIGSNRCGYFNYARYKDIVMLYGYTGPGDYFAVLFEEAFRYCSARNLQLNSLSDRALPSIDGVAFSTTPFGVLQRILDLKEFTLDGGPMRRLRYQVTKFLKAGRCRTEEYRCGSNPETDRQITVVMDRWCETRTVVNPLVNDVKAEILTGTLDSEHRVFLTWVDDVLQNVILITGMSAEENGYLMDLEFYLPEMPLGGLEYAISQIIEVLVAENCDVLSLGGTYGCKLEPCAGADPEIDQILDEPAREEHLQRRRQPAVQEQVPPGDEAHLPLPSGRERQPRERHRHHHDDCRSRPDADAGRRVRGHPVRGRRVRSRPRGGAGTRAPPRSHRLPASAPASRSTAAPTAWTRWRSPASTRSTSPPSTSSSISRPTPGRSSRCRRSRPRCGTCTGNCSSPSTWTTACGPSSPSPTSSSPSRARRPSTSSSRRGRSRGWSCRTCCSPAPSSIRSTTASRPREVPHPEVFRLSSQEPYKGNLAWDALWEQVAKDPSAIALVCVEVTDNAAGGYPVSLQHLREVRALLGEQNIPLVIDATRVLENAQFLIEHDAEMAGRSMWAVVREILSCADAVIGSLTKDFGVNRGGIVATNDPALYQRLQEIIHEEGTGLDVIDRKLIALSLRNRKFIEGSVLRRIEGVRRIWRALHERDVPVVQPPGAHCVVVDVKQLPEFTHPRGNRWLRSWPGCT